MAESAPRPFQTLRSEVAWECPWYRVRRDEIVLPDGKPGVYNVVEKTDAVWVLPVTREGLVPLLWQYRYTVDDWCWEIPAGGAKPGQTAEQAAREELREEVGGQAEKLEYIGRFYLANGICNEVGHVFFAANVELGATAHESAEVMEIHLKPAADVLAMAHRGEISDGPTALAILLCAERLARWEARSSPHSGR